MSPAGCGSSGASPGGETAQDGGDAGPAQPEAGGSEAGPDDAGAEGGGPAMEAGPPDYFLGDCEFAHSSGAVPTDAGALPHGLTVLATGVEGSSGIEVDGTYAYLAGGSTISRIPLAGGAPVVMVSNAQPVAMGIANGAIVWSDQSVPMQTAILSVPLTATGWAAFSGGDGGTPAGDAGDAGNAGDAGDAGAPVATTLATMSGGPGAFTVAGGYVYFTAGSVVARVPTAGGPVETVANGIGPTGIAVSATTAYFGDSPNEGIDQVMLGVPDGGPIGGFAVSNGTPTQLALSGSDLYWGDWFGGIESVPLAMPYAYQDFGTPCGGGACYPRHVRAGGPGAIWESGDNICGSVGVAGGPGGGKLFADGLAAISSIAADGQHLYAVSILGELLRWDF
jgi:hypothetical protein